MEEKFEGPLEIDDDFFETVIEWILGGLARHHDLTVAGLYTQGLNVEYQGLSFTRGVSLAVFLRNGDRLLFFTPFVWPSAEGTLGAMPPNEKSLLFPIELLYRLPTDEQVRIINTLLEAVWKEAEKLDEDDAVELFEEN